MVVPFLFWSEDISCPVINPEIFVSIPSHLPGYGDFTQFICLATETSHSIYLPGYEYFTQHLSAWLWKCLMMISRGYIILVKWPGSFDFCARSLWTQWRPKNNTISRGWKWVILQPLGAFVTSILTCASEGCPLTKNWRRITPKNPERNLKTSIHYTSPKSCWWKQNIY